MFIARIINNDWLTNVWILFGCIPFCERKNLTLIILQMNMDAFAAYPMMKGCAGNHDDFYLWYFLKELVNWFLSIDVKKRRSCNFFPNFCVFATKQSWSLVVKCFTMKSSFSSMLVCRSADHSQHAHDNFLHLVQMGGINLSWT